MIRKSLARAGKSTVEKMLFWGRRTFVERNLNPSHHSVLISWATYSPWLQDPVFQQAYAEIRNHTLVDRFRCYELWHLLSQTQHLPGDVLEVGTWRGGTGCLMARRATELGFEARVHLCDTFEGVVKTGVTDSHYRGGEHADTSDYLVRQLANAMNLKNIIIHKGIFPEDIGPGLMHFTFRFCHIDVDVYQSGKDTLDWIWPRLPVGGIVVFDDFGFASCPGITRLVHEEEQKPDRVCVQNLNGHAVLIKVG